MGQTLTEIKALLASQGLHPKKRFGQNFLHDANHMRRIIDAAEVEPGDLVFEVGAGTGALTERLLEAGARVIAVEIDRDLEAILRDRLSPYEERVTLVVDDVLDGKHELDPTVRRLVVSEGNAAGGFKHIANLPYNVASPLLVNLVVDYPQMKCAVVMVQREVAQRLRAAPGGKDYGPLSVMVQAMCEVEAVSVLPPSCFWPQPQVDSSVVKLKRRPQPLTPDPRRLARMLHTLFSKRRKQLGSILGRDTKLPEGIDPKARPESLTVEQLIHMAETIQISG
jgi:16S rRNA (adenine1518-N6/adenine1519-N6)-dimethyltransferase